MFENKKVSRRGALGLFGAAIATYFVGCGTQRVEIEGAQFENPSNQDGGLVREATLEEVAEFGQEYTPEVKAKLTREELQKAAESQLEKELNAFTAKERGDLVVSISGNPDHHQRYGGKSQPNGGRIELIDDIVIAQYTLNNAAPVRVVAPGEKLKFNITYKRFHGFPQTSDYVDAWEGAGLGIFGDVTKLDNNLPSQGNTFKAEVEVIMPQTEGKYNILLWGGPFASKPNNPLANRFNYGRSATTHQGGSNPVFSDGNDLSDFNKPKYTGQELFAMQSGYAPWDILHKGKMDFGIYEMKPIRLIVDKRAA